MESSEHTEQADGASLETVVPVPTYIEDHEIRGARAGYGSSYERLIASGAIKAPTHDELSDADLAERLKADDEPRAAQSAKPKE